MTQASTDKIQLNEVQIGTDKYYQISNVDNMRPFFMSIVSDSNHWMFIGSNGGLSAGRKNSDYALFPYYTDDKIIENNENTGSKSIFIVGEGGRKKVWEPFSIRFSHLYNTTRNLYKSIYGNKVLFEEINHDLKLTFRYQWSSSDTYGFVRTSDLINNGKNEIQVSILDGIQNIMPYGVGAALQNQSSNLVDAYKRSELIPETGIGIFALSAIIVDKAEPSEALKSNVVWSEGLEQPSYLLSSLQLDDFRQSGTIKNEVDVKAERGAYFIKGEVSLSPDTHKEWIIVATVNQTLSSIIALSEKIKNEDGLAKEVHADVKAGTRRLIELNASSDALQLTADKRRNSRHFSNTLFNIMRGGIFDNNYQIEKIDLMKYLSNANKQVFGANREILEQLPGEFPMSKLNEVISTTEDNALKRLCTEYLPLKFSRRHGDPSRPWNQFSINTKDEHDGSKILDYEGNWRDIFQNWEALAHSFPEFSDGMIFRFLNASTFDGYNPYRITKNGIDWERIEPDDPWSYIGYWGDHQIIYLLKFLEFSENHYPGRLERYFNEDLFVYANVPYRIKPYEDLLANPKDTIDFDEAADNEIMDKWPKIGADSVLLENQSGQIHQINLVEKILATVLAKMSNFIPEAGIWMNTQRPEWNDANNALVGNGVSAVTLYYLIRFLKFTKQLVSDSQTESVSISEELHSFYHHVFQVLDEHKDVLSGPISDAARRRILDGLGIAGGAYREKVYNQSFNGGKKDIAMNDLIDFTDVCLLHLSHTLEANKRKDNLYHAYNLMTVAGDDEISISYLSEMLEGQVAVLSSGHLSSQEALNVLDALKASDLFRPDQYSYLLYPEKVLPGFMEKNTLPADAVAESDLLKALVNEGNTQIIEKDIKGDYHFNGSLKNAGDLKKKLEALQANEKYAQMVQSERTRVLGIFEDVFNHKAFTGRSGTFYGYEGLGSIYWHMVSKLLLAVQECCLKAIHDGASDEIIGRLLEHYYEIHAGIGVHKSPELYGAFPTDPYSHTPKGKGAQQPGMTGQVKEDIICRFGELGVDIIDGQLVFNPSMLKREEFLKSKEKFTYIDTESVWKELEVSEGSICFTYCQVPVMYTLAENEKLLVTRRDGSEQAMEGVALDVSTSEEIFQRSGGVIKIVVHLNPEKLK